MDFTYFQKINNTYQSNSKQETDLFLLNRHVNQRFAGSIDYQQVLKNDDPFELLIIRDANNTFKKKIKSRPGQKVNLGDIITWGKQKWIVTSLDPDDKTYNSMNMWLCTIMLSFQNSKGEIIDRWCFDENLTKYSSGVVGNSTIRLGDYQYGIQMNLDEETKHLKRDMRFVIDEDGIESPDVYKITNREVKTSNYDYFGRGKIIHLTLSYHAFNKEKDKLIKLPNGESRWICDYIDPTTLPLPSVPDANESSILSEIQYKSSTLKIGKPREFIAKFSDDNDNILDDLIPKWTFVCGFDQELLTYDIYDNVIKLNVLDNSLIGESFILRLDSENGLVTQSEIRINIDSYY